MFKQYVKSILKKVPGYQVLDIKRRRLYESPLMDFFVRPLAQRLEEWPPELMIDTTNLCNAKCLWCPNWQIDIPRGVMDERLFRKIVSDYARKGGMIYLGTFGEPLLDQRCTQRVEFIRTLRTIVEIGITTNAYYLDEKVAQCMIENGVKLWISLDEVDENTYIKVKGLKFDVVRRNILQLINLNEKSSHPTLVTFRIKTSQSKDQIFQNHFYQKIAQLDSSRYIIKLAPVATSDSIGNWAGTFDRDQFSQKYKVYDNGKGLYARRKYNLENQAPCIQLWKWMTVYWNGAVVLCCADIAQRVVLGNLNDSSIEEIWYSEKLRKIRQKAIKRKKYQLSICSQCDMHQGWQYLRYFYNSKGFLYRKGREHYM